MVREVDVQFDRLHVEWNPDIVSDVVRFYAAVYAPLCASATDAGDDAGDDAGVDGGATRGPEAARRTAIRVHCTATLRSLSLALVRPGRPTAPLLTVALSQVTAGAQYWVGSASEAPTYALQCALGDLVANVADASLADPNVLRLKLARGGTPRARGGASGGGGGTEALVLKYSNHAVGRSDDVDGTFYMRLQPARFVYVHRLALEVVDYMADGVMGSLLKSTAEATGGLIESQLQASPRVAFDVQIEHPTLVVPANLQTSQRDSIVATQRVITITNAFETGAAGAAQWPVDVIALDVKGMMLECDGQRLLGDDTDLSLRVVRALAAEGADPPRERVDLEIDARFPVGITFRCSKRAYRCIMRTLTSNFGETDELTPAERLAAGGGQQQQQQQQSKHSKTAVAFAGAVIAIKAAKRERPPELKIDGLLMKLNSTHRKWSLRYFAVTGDKLVYFRDGDIEPRFAVDVGSVSVRELEAHAPSLVDYGAFDDGDGDGGAREEETSATKAQRDGEGPLYISFLFASSFFVCSSLLLCALSSFVAQPAFAKERLYNQRRNCFVLSSASKSMILRAASEESMHAWIDCILAEGAFFISWFFSFVSSILLFAHILLLLIPIHPFFFAEAAARRGETAHVRRGSVIAIEDASAGAVPKKESRAMLVTFSLWVPAIKFHISTDAPLALFMLDSLRVRVERGGGAGRSGSAIASTATIYAISIHDERPSAVGRPFTHLLRRAHGGGDGDARATLRNVEKMLFVGAQGAEQGADGDQLRFELNVEPQSAALTEEVTQHYHCRTTLLGSTGFAVFDALSDIADFFARSNAVPAESAAEGAAAPPRAAATAPPRAAATALVAQRAASASASAPERPALCTGDEYDDAARFVDTMQIPAMPTSDSFDVELCATSIYALVLEDAQSANTSVLILVCFVLSVFSPISGSFCVLSLTLHFSLQGPRSHSR